MNLSLHESCRDDLDCATASLEAMQLDEANRFVRSAIRHDPDNRAARVLDARIQLRRNLPEFAMAALDVRDQLDPDNRHHPDVAMLRAKALAAGDFDDMAIEQLNKLVVSLPDDPQPHRMLGGIYLKRKQPDLAIKHLQHVKRLVPDDHTISRLLSTLLQTVDPAAAAEQVMAIPTHDDDSVMKLRQARMCRKTDRLRDAADLYQQLLENDTQDAALWIEAGSLADERGESDIARSRLEHALTLGQTRRTAALDALAIVHMHCGRFIAASVTWWKVTKQIPRQPRAWAGLWLCAQCAGRSSLMTRARRKLAAHSTAAERCTLLSELWPHAAAARTYHAVIRPTALADDVGSPLQELLAAATHTLKNAAELHRDRADVFFHHATIKQAQGSKHAAETALKQALAINPNYAAAQHLMATMNQSSSDTSAG